MITIVLFLLVLVYVVTIIYLIHGFDKINSFDCIDRTPKTKFSIIVPFRNEAENVPKLINSLSKLNYPNDFFEVILVDDASDFKLQIADYRFQISIINNKRVSHSPKKDAISTAIKVAQNEWIITTDADCEIHENWLLVLDNYIQQHQVSMIAGAVTYVCESSFLHHFQQLDLASLQGATIGSFGLGKGFMCNGANFAYTKSIFQELGGFVGNNNIASGDDVFLLQKAMAQFPEKVQYVKSENNIVATKPMNDWTSLFYQRVRWASKTGSYQSSFGKSLGLIVFGGNISLWFVVYGLLFGTTNFYLLCFLLFAKIVIDFVLIHKTNVFLKNKTRFYLISGLLYPFFSVIVALYSLCGKYEWKGRRF